MTKYLIVLGDDNTELMKIEVQVADGEALYRIGEKLALLLGLRFWYTEED
jgi:hypothetical protein